MNAAPAPGLDLRAIGIGAAVGIGASLAMAVMWMLFPVDPSAANISVIIVASHAIGALIDIATGAAAGWLAGRRGSMHGLFAGLIANIVSIGVGYATTLLRTEYGRTVDEVLGYLMALLPWQVIGIAMATLAGAIAVRLRARAAR